MKVAWGLAESTITGRMRCAERLVDFLGGHPAIASKTDILEFLEKYPAQGMYKGIRVIYGRYLKTDLASDVKIPKSGFKPKKIPPDEAIRDTYSNLETLEFKTAYLMLASSGMRRSELMSLTPEDIEFDSRMVTPNKRSATKGAWLTFYNAETEEHLDRLGHLPNQHFPDSYTRAFKEASSGEISPQVLRQWFADKMGRLGVQDRFVDAFCGRTPKSVLANNYSDFRPRRLEKIYKGANLRVLD
ncbi:hypothetical protein AKJ58_01110 [candidate division MSBL1 archaeon SCGC-AAA385D11]|uniref:Tyr recombinase domain-containing protein n=1 Tax=candidate division MSBL1 archaeon SCGC-AAA385D11 TaxID=1698286 RepID=A0A133VNM4_9EURY|nr:hypothetical protein AKJ58_01110 [candidate division MSBL1 archaeon SCGC-AAA385D11]